MPSKASLAAARDRKRDLASADRAQAVTRLQASLRVSLSPAPGSDHTDTGPLTFPESATPMEPPSDEENTVPTDRITRSKKRKSDAVSDVSDAEEAVKPKKKSGPKPKAPILDGNETDDDTPLPKKKKKKKKPKAAKPKKKAATSDSDDVESVTKDKAETGRIDIVFMIPEALSNGNQRVSITSSTSFEDAVEKIHETIGCVSVSRKPTLAYKLSTSTAKVPAVNLRTNDDWAGLITDVKKKITAKKDLSVTIEVLPDNMSRRLISLNVLNLLGQYMFSLRAKNKKNTSQPATKGKKRKMAAIDLDNDDSEGEGNDDDSIASGEKEAMAELDAEYRGNHHHLSFPQRRGWAVSLACGTLHVTKTTPPQSQMFSMFHGKGKDVSTTGPSTSKPGPQQPYPWYPPPMQPLGYGMAGFPGYPQIPPPQHHDPPFAAAHRPMLSSDPPDDATSYPSVIDFIETLIIKAPQRQALRALGETLDSLHLFDTNEITGLTVNELATEKFGNIILGDAQFLLVQVAKEVKRLDKLAKRARFS
ncbi:hypothetical protein C8R44DRAFT_981519 [Mycena epipterygia]|nr:hypothetical protein C8R44DRAFT_981519 [Mycena epipterygia]